jgi:tRNA nucleotidyltransferase (CCA-adding enzyme)
MDIYLVGGALRDELLELAVNDRDFVVVGADVTEMLDLGYHQVGKDFPVFLHPKTQEEYALARIERKTAQGYTGFEFDTQKSVTLIQDLSRRDLTINAMARDKKGQLIDPFGGEKDLQMGLLRHVSSAFSEDPVRVLRVARFAARFSPMGFKVAHTTHKLMLEMSASGEVDALVGERVFAELKKSLDYQTPSAFFKVLCTCNAYEKVFSSLKCMPISHKDAFNFLDNLAAPAYLKFAIWLKDEQSQNITTVCKAIKCPKKYTQLALLTAQFLNFMQTIEQQGALSWFAFFSKTDALRRTQRFSDLLKVYQLLDINTEKLIKLRNILSDIDIQSLDKTNLRQSIVQEKKRLIKLFLNPT